MLMLTLTVALLVLPSLSHAEICYIRPSYNTSCPKYPCYTLSVYAEHQHHHLKNITLHFLPGDHSLDGNISRENLQQLEIVGNSSAVIPTRVVCSSNVGFTFRNISKVKVNGLAFISCARISRNHNPYLSYATYISHYALYIESVLMVEITDCTFRDSYGSALVVVGSHVVLRGSNNFLNNCWRCLRGGCNWLSLPCYGGSMYVKRSSLSFSGNCSFTNNSAYEGGGVFILASDMIFSGNTMFTSNSVIESGGGITAVNSNVRLSGSTTFIGNSAGFWGGGISMTESNMSFSGSATFSCNSATSGGGISAKASSMSFSGTTFTGNTASNGGGVYTLSNSIMTFSGSTTFNNNSALIGGGLDIVNGKYVNFRGKTTFSNNSASKDGGGFSVSRCDVSIGGHSSFSKNSAGDNGGGIYAFWGVNMNLSGNIMFSDNSAGGDGGGVLTWSTNMNFHGNITFTRNSGSNGGGISARNSVEIIFRGIITFAGNLASNGGGVHSSLKSSIRFRGNASFIGNSAKQGSGGGVHTQQNGRVDIFGSTIFLSNSASSDGGGVYACDNGYVSFSGNTTFTNNSAENGGCVFADKSVLNLEGSSNFNKCSARANGGAIRVSGIRVDLSGYSVFDGNTARGFGGGLYAIHSSLYLPGKNTFSANTAGRGGAIYAPQSRMNISGTCMLSTNMAQLDGGGIYADGSNVEFCGNITIRYNSAKLGGGIYSDNNTWNIGGSNIIEANIASYYGGGIYTRRTLIILIGHSTFFANSAGEGGGVYATANSTVDFDGVNIFKANRAHVSGGGVWLDYSYLTLNGYNYFLECVAGYEGGGIFTYNATAKLPGNNTFIFNSATAGGGIHSRWSKMTITWSSNIKNNKAVFGGGIFTDNSTFDIHGSSIFTANQANYTGGGIYAARSVLNFLGNSSLYLTSNHATRDGGGLYTRDGCKVNLLGFNKCMGNSAGDTGGGLSAFRSTLKISGHSIFESNSAETGGGLYAFDSTVNLPGENTFTANTASNHGGGFTAVRSTLHLSGSTEMRSNSALRGGGMYIDSSVAIMDGSDCFMNDTAMSVGGAIHIRKSVVKFNGRDAFIMNSASSKGGSVFATHSSVSFAGTSVIQNSVSTHGAAIALSFTTLIFQGNSFFISNSAKYGGAIHSESSNLTFANPKDYHYHFSIEQVCLNCPLCQRKSAYASSNNTSNIHSINFANNTALKGGALYLDQYSNFSLHPTREVHFQDNQATDFGGAIYVADVPEPDRHLYLKFLYQDTNSRSQCFFHILGKEHFQDVGNPPLVYENNSAGIRGSVLYGGLLNKCNFMSAGYSNALQLFNISGDKGHVASSISSDPTQLCFCNKTEKNCTQELQQVRIFPGQDVAVSVIAVDQSDKAINTFVHANVTSSMRNLGTSETISYEVGRNCTNKRFSVKPTNSYTRVVLYPSHLSGKTIPLVVNITFDNCPIGFEQSNFTGECICDHRLWQFTNTCKIDTQTIERLGGKNGNFWLGVSYSNGTAIGFIHHPYCPLNYCTRLRKHVSFNDLDEQCNFNRSGLLCGKCRVGLSLVLGSSQCQECSNKFLALLIPFALAGIVLMILLSFLHLTVASGTLHGLIFYANIVAANHHIYFPQSSNHPASIFIAWLNLDLGIQTCFYDGMDAYAKTWLQFLFPIYIWGIMGFLVFISDRSTRMTKLIGSSPVPVLATLFLLSYAKVLHTIIAALSPTILYYPSENRVVWVWDADISLLRYIPLVTVALLFLFFIFLPYTALLLLGQCLQSRSHFCILSWVKNPKLKAILDSYHAPYKPQHRYWPGLLLLVRCVLFLVFSFNLRDDISINLLATLLTTLGISIVFGLSGMVYKNWCMNTLELSFVLNLGILTGATYHVNHSGGNQAAVTYISVGITFLTFVGILAYHIYLQIKLKVQSIQHGRYLQGRRNLCCENGKDGNPSLEAVSIVPPTRSVVEYHEFRSPLDLLETN